MTNELPAPDPAASHAATWKVGWSRGRGCSELAAALGDAVAVKGDWAEACVRHKLDLLVTRRIPTFDLVSIAVPYDLDLSAVRRVAAAIGEGPHSQLAGQIAAALATALGVPGELTTVTHPDAKPEDASLRLERMGAPFPDLDRRVLEAPTAAALVKGLPPQSLLVLGAPGGSWLQRQLFGPGHRMRVAAPGGAVVVRHAPRRCFHSATSASGHVAGPHLVAADASRIFAGDIIPIAEGGRLIGIVRRSSLGSLPDGVAIGDAMEAPVSVGFADPTAVVDEVRESLGGGPIPVVNDAGEMVGVIATGDAL
jgi:hypothetical protein